MQLKTFISFRIAVFCLLALPLLALLAACGNSGTGAATSPTATANTVTSTPTSSDATPTAAATSPTSNASSVSITNFSFSPATLTVSVGTRVTWTNNDSVTHTVTANQGAFDSNDLSPGSTFSFTFTKAGTYAYHCKIHTTMTATIIVN